MTVPINWHISVNHTIEFHLLPISYEKMPPDPAITFD